MICVYIYIYTYYIYILYIHIIYTYIHIHIFPAAPPLPCCRHLHRVRHAHGAGRDQARTQGRSRLHPIFWRLLAKDVARVAEVW